MFEKTLALVLMKRTAPGGSPVKLLLSGAVSVVVLAFAVALLIALSAAAGLYFAYHLLLSSGVAPETVILLVYVAFAVILLVLIRMALSCVGRIYTVPEEEKRFQGPFARQIGYMLNGLGEGFHLPPR